MNPLLDELIHVCTLEYVVIDQNFCITHASNGAPRFALRPEEVFPGNDIRSGFPELAAAEGELRAILQGRYENWKLREAERSLPDEAPFYVNISVEPHPSQPASLIVTLEDITERIALERKSLQQSHEAILLLNALKTSKTYIEMIIDSMADALFVTSPEGIMQMVNRTATELFEYSRAELIGQPFTLIINDETLVDKLRSALSESEVMKRRSCEVTCKSKSGKDVPISFSCAVVKSDDDIHGFVYLGRDIRERKLTEQEISKLQSEKIYLQEEIKVDHNFEEIVGSSSAMKKVFKQIQKVAATDSTVLLSGETGTGKELIARAIHNVSNRKEKVLVKVNCAALPSGLVESELFGHEKGAFTGASSKRIGRFELADGGTILMDEVGDLPLDTQSKLLRIIQEHECERVGGTQTLNIDVRIIAATNEDLEESVKIGAFREDLFYRLNVFPIHVPPLRDRDGDIPLLANYFISKLSKKINKRMQGITQSGMERLIEYPWPGNVRELASVIERAVILCEGGQLKESDLALTQLSRSNSKKTKKLEDIEREHILKMLKESEGIIEGSHGAAIKLGIHPATLRSRMRKLGIHRRGATFTIRSSPRDIPRHRDM